MIFTVYVLYSDTHQKHYTGFTSNFEARLLSHTALGTKDWTMKYRLWRVLLKEEYADKREATNREKWLKTGVGRDFIKTIPISSSGSYPPRRMAVRSCSPLYAKAQFPLGFFH